MHAMSARAFQDPYHRRFIPEATWSYFNREWREQTGLDHYPIHCDFKIENMTGTFLGDWGTRALQAQQYATTHYINVFGDLDIHLTALKE